jgi:hypothetical protein
MSMDVADLAAETVGLRLALAVLTEALVRHDAIAYHQLRETLAEAIEALETGTAADAAVLSPLRRLAEDLNRTHRPAQPNQPRPHLDWRRVLADLQSD